MILAWIVIISMVTVVYGIAIVAKDGVEAIPEGNPPVQNIQEYSGGEKHQQGLSFFIAINRLWLSISTVPGAELIQSGYCMTEDYDLCGSTMKIKISLTI